MKKRLLLSFTFTLTLASASAQFTGKPQYDILTIRAGNDTIGTTRVELFPNIAPLHTANFDSLVSESFYDTTAFHRVIPGFMIQGGDPNSRHGPVSTWGYGDPTQPTVNAEFTKAKHLRGRLSAARDTDPNSANSQFFICVAAASWLDGDYSVYGRVVSGMNFVDSIVNSPRDASDNPLQKIEMFVTYAGSNDSVPNAPVLTTPLDASFSASPNRTLKWVAEPDGIIYHVEVSTDSTFATTYRSVDVGTNLYTVTGMTPGMRYYWRVNTNNGGHFSTGWSQVWDFLISGAGMEDYANAEQISVSPNPSNGIFLLSNLDKENTIEIFDVTGRSVLRMVAGDTAVSIDLSGNAKGMYFVRVRDENGFVRQGKIILE